MSNESSVATSTSVFRIDKFVVPADVLPTLMERVRRSQRLLNAIPGCRQNLVLTQTGNAGEVNLMTLVEWESADAVNAAKAVVQETYAQEGFDPASFLQSLGVRMDVGIYTNA
ncbi:MAG: antibiotic biosynthesis monooxygenase [Candidatus Eremiobacteraeota bacterium]|nr:antibiotic biosynthesis monooxygenase [Candidatus Eremiobacteraeota bacterium]